MSPGFVPIFSSLVGSENPKSPTFSKPPYSDALTVMFSFFNSLINSSVAELFSNSTSNISSLILTLTKSSMLSSPLTAVQAIKLHITINAIFLMKDIISP